MCVGVFFACSVFHGQSSLSTISHPPIFHFSHLCKTYKATGTLQTVKRANNNRNTATIKTFFFSHSAPVSCFPSSSTVALSLYLYGNQTNQEALRFIYNLPPIMSVCAPSPLLMQPAQLPLPFSTLRQLKPTPLKECERLHYDVYRTRFAGYLLCMTCVGAKLLLMCVSFEPLMCVVWGLLRGKSG